MVPTPSRVIALGALLLAPIVSTTNAQTIDQSNPATGSYFSLSEFWVGQTFRPTASTVAGGGLNLLNFHSVPAIGTLAVQLWSDVPSNGGATLLAGGTTSFTLAASSASFVDVFWGAVGVTPGNQYFLAFSKNYSSYYAVYTTHTQNDAYANGNLWYNGWYSVTTPYSSYAPHGYDLSFREYAAVVTPEPATITLLATGLAGILGVARRRRNRAA